MATVIEHYESHLAEYYTWIYGGMDTNLENNRQFFSECALKPQPESAAIDLGCGSGFQSIPLAELGYRVTAIDLSPILLEELNKQKGDLPIQTVQDNLLLLEQHCSKADLVVCMGDTLTHLVSLNQVDGLMGKIYHILSKGGQLILTFRDLTSELEDLDRFIPVRQDDHTLFTCFLEYEPYRVKVHDLIYVKQGDRWKLKKSAYYKIKIPLNNLTEILESYGFKIIRSSVEQGIITIIANKS